MANHYGQHTPLWRRALGLPRRETWQDRHPLPGGWRPRTRIDDLGREVEPWGYGVWVGREDFDGGEWWLPTRTSPDEAAYLILERWLSTTGVDAELDERELRGLRVAARLYAPGPPVYGLAYARELIQTALTR